MFERIKRFFSFPRTQIIILDSIEDVIRQQQALNNSLYSCKVIIIERLHNEKDMCPICLGDMIECIKTECNHKFHQDCLMTWIRTGNNRYKCPLCVTDMSIP